MKYGAKNSENKKQIYISVYLHRLRENGKLNSWTVSVCDSG